uniref:Uncharacterized protein n=1 Tax=Triticum urartu TaxID=4572 RepID=A0A8R7VCD3_TRIUA
MLTPGLSDGPRSAEMKESPNAVLDPRCRSVLQAATLRVDEQPVSE